MASGKKNYFRHSAAARRDIKIVNLIAKYGKQAYFHYFILVEMCAEKALDDELNGDEEFVFHKRIVCNELIVTPQKLALHLAPINEFRLGHAVVSIDEVKIKFPNLPKYLGRYGTKFDSNSTNKRKENKIKENKINEPENGEDFLLDEETGIRNPKNNKGLRKPAFSINLT